MKFSWGKLAGVGLGAAGLITGNPVLIAAGASVLSTAVKSDAAKEAADTQEAGVAKARTESDALYNTARTDANALYTTSKQAFEPYMQMGAGAMGNLGQLVGLPPGGSMASSGAAATVPGQVPDGMPGSAPMTAQAAGAPGQAQLRGAAMNESGLQGKREGMDLGALGGLVLLQAPTGELKRVPHAAADSFVQRGAQVVG